MKHESENDPRIIKSVQRVIDIISLFNTHQRELGITEIASQLGLAKSTAAGLIYTLEKNLYLDQNPDTRRYRLGLRLVERAATALDTIEIRQIAFPYIARLRDELDESVYLGIPKNGVIVIIARVLSSKVLGVRTGIGESIPLIDTAVGTAYLSGQEDGFISASIQDHQEMAGQTFSQSQIRNRRATISKARELGYAVNLRGRERGVSYFASPIFDLSGCSIATISVSVPTVRLPDELIDQLSVKVRETSLSISSELGYQVFTREKDL